MFQLDAETYVYSFVQDEFDDGLAICRKQDYILILEYSSLLGWKATYPNDILHALRAASPIGRHKLQGGRINATVLRGYVP